MYNDLCSTTQVYELIFFKINGACFEILMLRSLIWYQPSGSNHSLGLHWPCVKDLAMYPLSYGLVGLKEGQYAGSGQEVTGTVSVTSDGNDVKQLLVNGMLRLTMKKLSRRFLASLTFKN